MKVIKIVAIFATTSILFSVNVVSAACVCRCVNGSMEALCSSSIDMRPICPPTVCPIVPPSVMPTQTPTIPPIGTSSCTQEQVYDANSDTYQWKTICR